MVALLAILGRTLATLLAAGPMAQTPMPQLPDGARLVASTTAGPDSTGATETLIAYFIPDASSPGGSFGRLGALVVRSTAGASQVYPLRDELGEAAFAELVARDINGDGVTELGVLGAVGAHSFTLNLFRWSGSGYALLDEFFGDSGLTLEDLDGDRIDEVIIGLRHYDRAQLRHDAILKWNGAAYKPHQTRWGFTFDDASFQEYPEAVVLQYYLAIADRNYPGAWDLLGPSMRSGQTYAAFEQGFATTRDVWVEDLEVVNEDAAAATVRASIGATEVGGVTKHFEGTWILNRASGQWRLNGAYVTET